MNIKRIAPYLVFIMLFAFEGLKYTNAVEPPCSARNNYQIGGFNFVDNNVVRSDILLKWTVIRNSIANPQYDCISNFSLRLVSGIYTGIIIEKLNFPASEFPGEHMVYFADMIDTLMVVNETNIPFKFTIFLGYVNQTWTQFNTSTTINGIYHYNPATISNETNMMQDIINYLVDNPLLDISIIAVVMIITIFVVNKKKQEQLNAEYEYY